MRITVCNFSVPKTGLSAMGDRLLYAIPLEAPQEDIDREKSCLSDNTDRRYIINEDVSDSMSCYREKVMSTDATIRGKIL